MDYQNAGRVPAGDNKGNLVENQGLSIHLLGLFQAHQVQHGRRDIGQAAGAQLHVGAHDAERHQIGGMGNVILCEKPLVG